jgi:predicted alpha/beta-fold hydrolase
MVESVSIRCHPVVPADAIPETAIRSNPALTPVISDHGGHVGLFTGRAPCAPHFWAEDRIVRWLRSDMFGV